MQCIPGLPPLEGLGSRLSDAFWLSVEFSVLRYFCIESLCVIIIMLTLKESLNAHYFHAVKIGRSMRRG